MLSDDLGDMAKYFRKIIQGEGETQMETSYFGKAIVNMEDVKNIEMAVKVMLIIQNNKKLKKKVTKKLQAEV